MSKNKRHTNKRKDAAGKLCQKCKKTKLIKACGNAKGHEHHVYCPTCHYTNF